MMSVVPPVHALPTSARGGGAFHICDAQKGLPKLADPGKWGIDTRFDPGAGPNCIRLSIFAEYAGSVTIANPVRPQSGVADPWRRIPTIPVSPNPVTTT